MSKVKMSKEFLGMVSDLTTINNQVIVEKGDNGVFVKKSNPSVTVAYSLSASNEDVSFEDTKLAFYNYQEFYQLINVFGAPEIEQTDNKLVISGEKSKIKYLLSDPETLKAGPKNIKFENPDASIKLSKDNLKELKKMISLITAEKANLSVTGKSATIKLFNNNHDNSFEKTYELEKDCTSEFSFTITSEIFSLIPENEYVLEAKKEEIVKFKYVSAKFNLDIFTAGLTE